MFTRLGLEFRSVVADTGAIGGNKSEEFHVLAESGEDAIAFSDGDDVRRESRDGGCAAARRRRALPPARRCSEVATPGARTIADSAAAAQTTGSDARQDAARRRRPTAAWSRCSCAAITSSTPSRRRSCPASRTRCAWRPTTRIVQGYRRRTGVSRTRRLQGTRSSPTTPCSRSATSSAAQTARTRTSSGVNWGRDLPEPAAADLRNVVAGDPRPPARARSHRPRHRGRPHLPARQEIQRGHGRVRTR